MKYIIILVVFLSILACTNQDKYYTKRTVTASVTNKGEEKEVYRMTEIRELESKKLVERQERIVENYY